jgi:hypothetical protein
MQPLYHGSSVQNIKTLEPRKRFTPAGLIDFSAIYATSLRAFAVCHSFSWSSESRIDIEIKDEKVTLIVPTSLKSLLNIPISIYTVSADQFIKTEEDQLGATWHAIETVEVISESKYDNVMEAMESAGGYIEFV